MDSFKRIKSRSKLSLLRLFRHDEKMILKKRAKSLVVLDFGADGLVPIHPVHHPYSKKNRHGFGCNDAYSNKKVLLYFSHKQQSWNCGYTIVGLR